MHTRRYAKRSEPFWRFWINTTTGDAIIMELKSHQEQAIEGLDSGKILYGGVGAGKSRAIIAYYMKAETPAPIIVITTAKKRDTLDWEMEAARWGISTDPELSRYGSLTVDSWNNIAKYTDTEGAFFVFDEQRVVGHGAWVKNFLKIAKKNRWVLLSATPGDTWMDYAPVFIANGFYKNRQDFLLSHVVYEPFSRYPKVRGYLDEHTLEKHRNRVLVEMPYDTGDRREINWLSVGYHKELFQKVWSRRWNVFEDRPIKDAEELFRVARRVINSDPSRMEMVEKLFRCHDKIVIFYRWNYELDILRQLGDGRMCGCMEATCGCFEVAEWNGHVKQEIPKGERWAYLVQYTSGAEGWNCTETNAMIFFSMTGSYRTFEQAMGRIDRMDTPFQTLYYYLLVSDAVPDLGNKRSLQLKKDFNERKFVADHMREKT